MDAYSRETPPTPASGHGFAVSVQEIFPPQTLPPGMAREIAVIEGSGDQCQGFVDELAREPKQKDSFGLVARIDWRVVGWMKLQHGHRGDLWIRTLVVHGVQGDVIRRALVNRAKELMGPREQLIVEVAEVNTLGQLELARLGLECRPPWQRSKRQRERGVYEFRSFQPVARWPARTRRRFSGSCGTRRSA